MKWVPTISTLGCTGVNKYILEYLYFVFDISLSDQNGCSDEFYLNDYCKNKSRASSNTFFCIFIETTDNDLFSGVQLYVDHNKM